MLISCETDYLVLSFTCSITDDSFMSDSLRFSCDPSADSCLEVMGAVISGDDILLFDGRLANRTSSEYSPRKEHSIFIKRGDAVLGFHAVCDEPFTGRSEGFECGNEGLIIHGGINFATGNSWVMEVGYNAIDFLYEERRLHSTTWFEFIKMMRSVDFYGDSLLDAITAAELYFKPSKAMAIRLRKQAEYRIKGGWPEQVQLTPKCTKLEIW